MNEQDRDASRTRARMPALCASRLCGAAPPAHDSLLDEINSALQLLLDRIHCGLILLSADGTVVYLNRYASRIAHAGDAIAIRSRRLLFLDRNTQEQFRDRLRAACVASPAADVERSFAFRVTRVSTGAGYLAVHSSLWCGPGQCLAATCTQRSLWLFDPESVRCITASLLMQLHGLTPAQAQVAHSLFLGLSPVDVARELQISRHTVKTHLKDIFARCNVHSQAHLLRLIALTPALTSASSGAVPAALARAFTHSPGSCEACPEIR